MSLVLFNLLLALAGLFVVVGVPAVVAWLSWNGAPAVSVPRLRVPAARVGVAW